MFLVWAKTYIGGGPAPYSQTEASFLKTSWKNDLYVAPILQLCDIDIVSQSSGKTSQLSSAEGTARLSDERLYFNTLWVNVMRTLIYLELVSTSYNVALSLCCVLWNVTCLNLSRISSFKRRWELLTGVSTWLVNNLKLKYCFWRINRTDLLL